MPTQERLEAGFQGSIFQLELDGTVLGHFTGCTGLGFETNVISHKVVNEQGAQMEIKMPGVWTFNEVVFKRGVTSNMDLYNWFKEFSQGNQEWRTAAVAVLDRDLNQLARFSFDNCWPSKLSLSDLSIDSDEVMIEELTIQHQLLEWVA